MEGVHSNVTRKNLRGDRKDIHLDYVVGGVVVAVESVKVHRQVPF